MKRLRGVLLLVLGLVLGWAIGFAQPFVVRPELVTGQDAVVGSGVDVSVSVDDVGGRVISITPTARPAEKLLILYPGGLVRPQAYEWLGHALAAQGIQTVIPEFSFDLAVLDAGRAERLISHYATGRPVVIGGHSLGGTMAASFAADHPDLVAGIILMAAYPADDVSLAGLPRPALVLLAEHDEVADAEKLRVGLERMPGNTNTQVIDGAVHSFFGRYGPQAGDGQPTVSRAQAEGQITGVIADYLAVIR